MIFTVVWMPNAEQELADVWLNAADRNAVTVAVNQIDEDLRSDPQEQGDLRYDMVRAMVVGPLGVEFKIVEEDRLVRVLSVWDSSEWSPEPPMNGQLNT